VHYRTDRCRTPPAAHRAPHAGPLGGRITGWRGWPALPRPRCSPRPEGALGMYSMTPSTNSFVFQLMRVKARSTRGAVRMPASNGRCSHVPGRGSLPVPRRTPAAAWSVAAAAHPHRSAEGAADPVANAPGAPAGDRRTGRLPGRPGGIRGAGRGPGGTCTGPADSIGPVHLRLLRTTPCSTPPREWSWRSGPVTPSRKRSSPARLRRAPGHECCGSHSSEYRSQCWRRSRLPLVS
jgi:hypothetical protein